MKTKQSHLPNELPMVAMPIHGATANARSAAASLAKLTEAHQHGSSSSSRGGGVCSRETIEEVKSVGGCVVFTVFILSVLSGHAAASLGALAASRHARPAVAGNTTAAALRLGPGCATLAAVPSGAGPALETVATHTQPLSELRETASHVGYGRLGKGTKLGFEGLKARVEGTKYQHVLSMHPPSGWSAGGAFATFALPAVPAAAAAGGGATGGAAPARWCALVGAVAINDRNNLIGRAGSPLTFMVRDGATDALLWASEPIQSTGHVQEVRLALPSGVKALKLQVSARAALLQPFTNGCVSHLNLPLYPLGFQHRRTLALQWAGWLRFACTMLCCAVLWLGVLLRSRQQTRMRARTLYGSTRPSSPS
jgi:hypothetical protein